VTAEVGTVEMPVWTRIDHVGFRKVEADRCGHLAMNSSDGLGICRKREEENIMPKFD
jgi:hypothetical protein